jgi:hypothetical protein
MKPNAKLFFQDAKRSETAQSLTMVPVKSQNKIVFKVLRRKGSAH